MEQFYTETSVFYFQLVYPVEYLLNRMSVYVFSRSCESASRLQRLASPALESWLCRLFLSYVNDRARVSDPQKFRRLHYFVSPASENRICLLPRLRRIRGLCGRPMQHSGNSVTEVAAAGSVTIIRLNFCVINLQTVNKF